MRSAAPARLFGHKTSEYTDAGTGERVLVKDHRQANAALYRIVIVRMRWHQPPLDYVARRTAQGLTKRDIMRCLERFVAREIYHALINDHRSRTRALSPPNKPAPRVS